MNTAAPCTSEHGGAKSAAGEKGDVDEREKLVKSRNRGSRKLYFPAGVPMPGDGGGLHELQLRMLKVVDERPGIPLRDLAGTLGVSPELVRYHLRTLQMQRLVAVQRVGLSTQVFRVAGAGERPAGVPDT